MGAHSLALSTMGGLLASDGGLSAFSDRTPLPQILMDSLGSTNKESQLAALGALAQAQDLRGRPSAEIASACVQKLLNAVQAQSGASLAFHLMQQLTSPEPDIVEAAWAALAATAQHAAGVQAIGSTPGCCELVLDRSVTLTKAAKEWKYDCACNLVAQLANLEALLSSDLRSRLTRYKTEGPFAGSQPSTSAG